MNPTEEAAKLDLAQAQTFASRGIVVDRQRIPIVKGTETVAYVWLNLYELGEGIRAVATVQKS